MKMLCLASRKGRKESTRRHSKEWNETKPNNNNESTHGAAAASERTAQQQKSCPWISYNSGFGCLQRGFNWKTDEAKRAKKKNETNIYLLDSPFGLCPKNGSTHQPESPCRRRRNQFFISRRKIDNFWFLFSFFLFFCPFFYGVSSPKITSFSRGYSPVRNRKKETQKTIKKLKWCYNLWSVCDYNHTNFFFTESFLYIGIGRIKTVLKKLMSSFWWQKKTKRRNWF